MPSQPPNLQAYKDKRPQVHPEAFVHPDAVLIGDVKVGARASIWPGCVLRGDQGSIEIGEETSIQDGTIIHATRGLSVTRVGARVTCGHRVVLHGCTIGDDVLVGMGAVVMDLAEVGRFCIIGAAALLPLRMVVPDRSLVMGVPAKVRRTVTDAEIDHHIRHGHAEYLRLQAEYRGVRTSDITYSD